MKDDKNYDEYIRLYGEALLSMGHKKAAYEVFSAAYKDEPDVLIWKLFIDYFHINAFLLFSAGMNAYLF